MPQPTPTTSFLAAPAARQALWDVRDAVLGALLLNAGRVMSVDRLVASVWWDPRA
jgi:hypothetical protein